MTQQQQPNEESGLRVRLHAGSSDKSAGSGKKAAAERKRGEPAETGALSNTDMESGWMPYGGTAPLNAAGYEMPDPYAAPGPEPNTAAGMNVQAPVNAAPNADFKKVGPGRESLLRELQEIDFALVELTLYLDTHPYDMQAIQQFNQLAYQRAEIAGRYERQFGPLLQYGHSFTQYPWQWNDAPWPWQV